MKVNRMGSIRIIAVAITAGLFLAGCTGLVFDKAPPKLYRLTRKSVFDPNMKKVEWQLTIETPVAEAGINSSRIAVLRNPLSLDYYEGVTWLDTAPRLVQTLLVESFENSRKIVGVGRQSVNLRTDYTLLTDLREFQSELSPGGNPVAHVRINAKLVRFPDRVIVATMSADEKIPATGAKLKNVIQAFDKALGRALKKIVNWGLTSVPPERRGRRR
ncbi:MAG: ABC-type transport auxiliary lipoprotein family protein [Alphaproteobacteria bacterium]